MSNFNSDMTYLVSLLNSHTTPSATVVGVAMQSQTSTHPEYDHVIAGRGGRASYGFDRFDRDGRCSVSPTAGGEAPKLCNLCVRQQPARGRHTIRVRNAAGHDASRTVEYNVDDGRRV